MMEVVQWACIALLAVAMLRIAYVCDRHTDWIERLVGILEEREGITQADISEAEARVRK